MKKCKSCKAEIPSDAKKCSHCGTDQRGWLRKHPIITGILGLLILIIIFSVVNDSKSNTTGASVPAESDTTNNTTSVTVQPTKQAEMKTLLDIQGSGSKSTQKFTAAGDWDLNWTYDCTSFSGGTGNFQVFIYNGDGSMSLENSAVNQLGGKDSGTEHYHKGGTYYLQANSECSWTIQVKG